MTTRKLYQPPRRSRTGLRRTLWRWRVLFESTFGLGMMEEGECVAIYAVLVLSLALLSYALVFLLPAHVGLLRRRAAFYALGDEDAALLGADGVGLVRRWLAGATTTAATAEKGSFGAAGAPALAAAAAGLAGDSPAARIEL